MGCSQSKIEDEESVSRCRRQKQFVKQAVKSRNGFASAHANYLRALHRVGNSFRKFAEGQFRGQTSLPATPSTSTSLSPLPSIPTSVELPRSISLPPMALKNTPLPSETVILPTPTVIMSPPRSPKYRLDEDYYLNDAPPLDLYRSMLESGSGTFPNNPGSPSYSPPPIIQGWDWFNLFEAPPVPPIYKEQRSYMQIRGEREFDQDFGQYIPVLEIHDPVMKNTEKSQEEKTDSQKERKAEETIQEAEQQPEKAEQNDTQPQDQIQSQQTEEGKEQEQKAKEKNEEAEEVVTALEPSSETAEPKQGSETEPAEIIVSPQTMDMPDVLRYMEEEFLKASESGKEVSRLLEASKSQHHSSFLDSKGLSEHSSRLFRGLSWTSWSPRTHLSWTGIEGSEESSTSEDTSTTSGHASTLEKLYAWQKKLYQEVKDIEILNIELEKKRRLLRTLSARGHDEEKIDKVGGDVKIVATQMTVAFHTMEATLANIKKITDEEIFPQLVELLEGLANMWKVLSECHRRQREALLRMIVPENLPLESTGGSHKEATIELEAAINSWQRIFIDLTFSQKEYAQNLNGWIRFSIPLKQENKSHKALEAGKSPMYIICKSWQGQLEKLSDKPVVEAIKTFSEKLSSILFLQNEKQKVQRRREALAKELSKKSRLLNQEETRSISLVPGNDENSTTLKNSLAEKRESIEDLQKYIGEENEKFKKAIEETRALTMDGLQNALPQVFQALSEFASTCSRMYQNIVKEVKDGIGQEQG